MFTVYALSLTDNLDTETQCATLEEALCHLRELVMNEAADPNGPTFDRYGLHFTGGLANCRCESKGESRDNQKNS